jgi:hypothetical protein
MILEMRRRGHSEATIHKVVYENPLEFFRQSVRWQEFANPAEAERNGVSHGKVGVQA